MVLLEEGAGEDVLLAARRAQTQGDRATARRLFGQVLATAPEHVEALHVLGVFDYQEGQLDRARERVEKALAQRPDSPGILNNLGTIYLGLKRHADSLACYARAVELDPENLSYTTNLAVALSQSGQHAQAMVLAQRILSKSPENPSALNVLGGALRLGGRFAEAEEAFRRLLAVAPNEADSHYNLGVALQDLWRLDEALACYDAAIARNDRRAAYFVNRGAAQLKLHRVAEAERDYARAVALDPTLAEAHYNLAICRFLMGDLAGGAEQYEWRLKVSEESLSGPRVIDKPMWDGTPALDKTVLLHSEQGLGDMIQFVRFVRAVHAMVGEVILEVQRPLVHLFRDSFPGLTVIAKGETPPPFDLHAPLMSLMHRLQLTTDDLPASPVPYLKAQPERVQAWATRLNTKPGRKIAIAWQGNPKSKVDRGRSIPVKLLEPLLRLPGLRFISLQKNDGAEQLDDLPPDLRNRIETLGPDFDGGPDAFLDTLAVMENCDLVLTTDTAIAHIAGGLGRPTWTMLKFTPDWRWCLRGSACAWYPTMRLFRQTADGDWAGVVATVAGVLKETDPGLLLQEALQAHTQGKLAEAEAIYHRLLADNPDHVVARHHLGVIALQRRQYDVAETHILAALEKAPESVEILANLVLLQKAQGRLEDAVATCRAVLARHPKHHPTHNNLGNILRQLGRAGEALPHYQAALALNPDNPGVHHNLGLALHDLGRADEAKAPLTQAVTLAPNHPDFHFDLARALLITGDWAAGWREYEWRRKMAEFGTVAEPSMPRWTGAVQKDAILLVHAEQGLGDTFQFLRFVADARARVGRVLLVVPPPLKALAATAPGVDAVYGYGEAVPGCHLHIPLMSLPLVLGVTEETLSRRQPYLTAMPDRVNRWKAWRAAHAPTGLLIGLAWQGNPKARADIGRSLVLGQLRLLSNLPGVTFVALQKGDALAQVDSERREGFNVLTPDAPFDDGPEAFADAAALMSVCDLVLTTDTSIAHLAGALARPTWVMLKNVPDWRWLRERADSPWYPGMRLFRQPKPGDWGAVVAAVHMALYQQVAGAEVLCQRGLAAHQANRFDEAARLYEAALAREPDHRVATLHLGLVRYQQGQCAAAESLLRPLVTAHPEFAEAWGALALALKGQEKLDAATDAFTCALLLNPNSPDVHNNFGNLLTAQKQFDLALDHYRTAIRLQPSRADSYQNLGNALGDLERHEEAIENFRRALALRPGYVGALLGLGKAYRVLDRLDEAQAAFSEALEHDATSAEAWSNLGVIWREKGRFDEALHCYDEALRLKPDYGDGWGNRAVALHQAGRLDEAEVAYRESVRLKPDNPDHLFGLGVVLLTQGKLAEGWEAYEYRRLKSDFGPLRTFPQPLWQGENAPGKTLFLFTEQGLGDAIQFIRFVALVRARVGRVIVEVQPSLRRLFSSFLRDEEMVMRGGVVPPFDLYCPLMSLPRVLGTTLETLPARRAYLSAEADRASLWRAHLRPDGRKLIGLSWQGNPKAAIDKGRSFPLAKLVPLIESTDARFIVLQKNEGLEQVNALPPAIRARLELLGDAFDAGTDAFLDTAAVMVNLDLVLTSDTAIAHVAGALGVPCAVLLKFMPDWRWMVNRADSPWYPATHLFRQTQPDDWDSALRAAGAFVRALP